MTGRRVPFIMGWPGSNARPGDYCKVPPGLDPRGEGYWYVVAPNGVAGALSPVHVVTEHDDGTITVQPSVVLTGYHGFLVRGVWSP